MTNLSESIIDVHQLKVLLRTAWKTDLRGSGNPVRSAAGGPQKVPPIVGVLILKLVIGAGLAGLTFFIKDPFMASFCVISTMVVFLALTVLLEFANLILSPDDYQIIAVQPVGSKTFFAAKTIHLLAYVNALGFLLYFPSSVSVALANRNLLLFPASFFAGMLSATAIGLSFVLIYTLLLRIVNREVMQRVLGYVNLILMCAVYMSYFILPKMLGHESLLMIREFKSDWLYWVPAAWFAAIVKFAAGDISLLNTGAALLALLFLATVCWAGVSKLSLEYAKTLADTVVEQNQQEKKRRSGLLSGLIQAVTSYEDRAVWSLIRKQFKHDNRFKMSILGILPLTAIYVFLGISEGKLVPDPFLLSLDSVSKGGNILLYIAAAMFPYMITLGTVNSESYRSAWVFYTSPADRARIILSSSRFAMIWFGFPFTLLLAGVFTWYFHSIMHALLHCLFIYAVLWVLTKMMVLLYPRIPFSQPQKTGQRSLSVFIMMFVSLPLMLVPMAIISMIGYGGYVGYAIWLGGVLVLNFILHRVLQKTIPRRTEKMEFMESS